MNIVVTGASGLIGSALVPALRSDGHTVTKLVRRDPRADDEARWDPMRGEVDGSAVAAADAVVNLAGAGIGDRRWTASYKRQVYDGRINGTGALARALAGAADRSRIFISGSAVGYYGDRGGDEVDESSGPGDGFLPHLVVDWEAATQPAADAGVRVVTIRTGVVLAAEGGALGQVLPLFKAGLGGRLGSGRQWLSWIALADEVAAIRFLLAADDVSGAVNLTAPQPVRNVDYTKAVGRALHRPTVLPAPAFALRAAFPGFADEGILISQRVMPRRLTDAGFEWRHPEVNAALQAML
ncbi:MAG TPA: TIGR01777 family oxidoreductase [Mycobacteriales bacterium]|nr:TIGR01777 family oxidoreductase [Mycobacteriales bacterium]